MTLAFLDCVEIRATATADDTEVLDPFQTFGLLRADAADQPLRGQAAFDLRRLRHAVAAFEVEFEERDAELALVRQAVDARPLLALVPRGGADRAIVLAPRWRPDDPPDAEALLGGEDP